MIGRSQASALVLTVVIVASVIAGGAVVGAQETARDANETNPGEAAADENASETGVSLPPADDIYVEEDGDAVLTYANDTAGDAAENPRARYGMNVSQGLFHALVATDVNETDDVDANLTATLTPQNFTGNGTLDMARPDALSNLSANLSGLNTEENARYDATLAATVADENATEIPVTSARAAGNLTTSGSDFAAAFEAHAEYDEELGVSRSREYRITEGEGAFTLTASEDRPVSQYAAQQWTTREAATTTLERQYAAVARQLGGTATVTVDAYEFTRGTEATEARPRLDIEYSVTYEGVKNALVTQLSAALASSDAVEANESTTQRVTQSLRDLSVNEVYVKYDQDARSIDATMRADVDNYVGVVLAGLDVAESINSTTLGMGAAQAGRAVGAGGVGTDEFGTGGVGTGDDATFDTGEFPAENDTRPTSVPNATPRDEEGGAFDAPAETDSAASFGANASAEESANGEFGGEAGEDGTGGEAGESGMDGVASESGMGSGVGASGMGGAMAGTSAGFLNTSAASLDARLQQVREGLKAQRSANFTREYTFAANLTRTEETVAVAAESSYRTENWGPYLNATNRSENHTDVHYDLRAATEGDRVNVTASVEVSAKNLLGQATGQMFDADDEARDTGEGSETASIQQYVDAMRESGFQKSRMDFSIRDGRVRVETGAAFENMTALRDAFLATDSGQQVQSMVGRTENGTSTSYVRIDGAVGANATDSQVRALSYAGADTAIHQPGSWDREFPDANTSQAEGYLGLAGGSTSGLVGPGFGLVAAVIALLAAALVAARRRG